MGLRLEIKYVCVASLATPQLEVRPAHKRDERLYHGPPDTANEQLQLIVTACSHDLLMNL